MKHHTLTRSLPLALGLVIILSGVRVHSGYCSPQDTLSLRVGTPSFIVDVTYPELLLLQEAVRSGIERHGGEAIYAVRGVKADGARWSITLPHPQFLEVLEMWLGEYVAGRLAGLDLKGTVPDSSRALLATSSSTQAKINASRASPVWEPQELKGLLTKAGPVWTLATDSGIAKLDVKNVSEIGQKLEGHHVVASGAVRVRDRFDVLELKEYAPNTLEVFVMSHCPYAKRFESSLLGEWGKHRPNTDVKLAFRYIFQLHTHDGQDMLGAMHGEPEFEENVVQILVRDRYPGHYWDYLVRRASSDEPWKNIARSVGLSEADLGLIAAALSSERASLARKEYDYVSRVRGIRDGSPTLVWEGRTVSDLDHVPELVGIVPSTSGSCTKSSDTKLGAGG